MAFPHRSAFGKKNKYGHGKPQPPIIENKTLAAEQTKSNYGTKEWDEHSCCTNPDLIILRKNAILERDATFFYTKAASKFSGSLHQLFLDIAQDEMQHFHNTMAIIALLDPTQANELQKAGFVTEPLRTRAYTPPVDPYCEKCDPIIANEYLTKAITSELDTINHYQQSITQIQSRSAKSLLCENMNNEKQHLVEFWGALSKYSKENLSFTHSQ